MSWAFGLRLETCVMLLLVLFVRGYRPAEGTEPDSNVVNIAIVGAGIGGSSCSYFIRELFGAEANIDVFEASNRIGGRLHTVEIAGKKFESGGSIIHPKNKYMGNFVKKLGK